MKSFRSMVLWAWSNRVLVAGICGSASTVYQPACKVGARRTAKLCFPTPPSEPCLHLSVHTALRGLTFRLQRYRWTCQVRRVRCRPLRLARNSSSTKQLLDQNHVSPLASFPLYAAFPRAEYYDASDALICHRWTAHLSIHIRASHVHNDVLYGSV